MHARIDWSSCKSSQREACSLTLAFVVTLSNLHNFSSYAANNHAITFSFWTAHVFGNFSFDGIFSEYETVPQTNRIIVYTYNADWELVCRQKLRRDLWKHREPSTVKVCDWGKQAILLLWCRCLQTGYLPFKTCKELLQEVKKFCLVSLGWFDFQRSFCWFFPAS